MYMYIYMYMYMYMYMYKYMYMYMYMYMYLYIHIILYKCISNDIYVISVFVQGDVFCAFCVPFQVDGQLLEKAKLDGGGWNMRNPSPTVVTVVI